MSAWRAAGVGLASGLIFAVGLVLSGMTDPARVLAFLDVAGDWDPRLAFVMVGAIGTHASWLLWSKRRLAPAAQPPSLAPQNPVTKSLVWGAALFGVGWGMAGYCPGPAVVSLGSGAREGAIFCLAMLVGMALYQRLRTPQRDPRPAELEAAQRLS